MKITTLLVIAGLLGPVLSGNVSAAVIYRLTSENSLVIFEKSAMRYTMIGRVAVSGIEASQILNGNDFLRTVSVRNGFNLYSYTINKGLGAATLLGVLGQYTLSGAAFGFDFNLVYGPPVPPTELYGIDYPVQDVLVTQDLPNSGTLKTDGSRGFDTGPIVAFDVLNLDNAAFASLTPQGGTSSFFSTNLDSGSGMQIGAIGNELTTTGIAIQQVPEPETLALVMVGFMGLVAGRRRLRSKLTA